MLPQDKGKVEENKISIPPTNLPPVQNPFKKSSDQANVPVAVYKDPYAKVRRQLIKLSLLVIGPLLAIAIIASIVYFNFIGANSATIDTNTPESVIMDNIPLPGGSKLLSKDQTGIYSNSAIGMFSAAIPNYAAVDAKTEIYVNKKSVDDLISYYSTKMPKSGAWQQYNKGKVEIDSFIIYFYVRSTNTPKVIEGAKIQYEKLTPELLLRRGNLVGNKASSGDTLLYISKVVLRQTA